MNEVYKLTLEHYIVGDDGKKVKIDEPVAVQYVLCMKDNIGIPTALNIMIEKMKRYLMGWEE